MSVAPSRSRAAAPLDGGEIVALVPACAEAAGCRRRGAARSRRAPLPCACSAASSALPPTPCGPIAAQDRSIAEARSSGSRASCRDSGVSGGRKRPNLTPVLQDPYDARDRITASLARLRRSANWPSAAPRGRPRPSENRSSHSRLATRLASSSVTASISAVAAVDIVDAEIVELILHQLRRRSSTRCRATASASP